MEVLWLLHWLRGYCVICVPAENAGTLLTLCAHHGILLWKGEHKNNVFYGRIHSKLYASLQSLAEQVGLVPRLVNTYGFPTMVYRYRKRIGILIGIFVFLCGLMVSQQFIWKVEVEGNDKLEITRLLGVLEEVGIHRGVLKKNVDKVWTAREILIRVDELSWTALNFHGTTAILRIRERTAPPPKIDTNVPANVVAAEDGQVKKLQVTDGKAVLKEGDTVCKGEVIISGVWQDQWGLTHFVRAAGQAYAHVPRALTVKIPLAQDQYTITALKQQNYLILLGWKIPLFFYQELEGEYKIEQFSEAPVLFDTVLPFSLLHENIMFYEQEQETISQEMALTIAKRQLNLLEKQTFAEEEVISRTISAVMEGDTLVLHGEYEVEKDIAKKQDIQIYEYKTPDGKQKVPREGGY